MPADVQAHAVLVARQSGVIAGLLLAVATFKALAPDVVIHAHAHDGAAVAAGINSAFTISGPARAVLSGERTALNFVGRLSGIATLQSYVRHTAGTKTAQICCTRKTTPGLRALEKYAVRCGGGFNHRFGLGDAVLIKDNHIASAAARARCWSGRARIGHLVKIEIEVDTLDQLREVLDTGPRRCGAARQYGHRDAQAGRRRWRMVAWRWKLPAASPKARSRPSPRPASTTPPSGALTHSAPNFDVALDIDA
ncbi:MAG: nicotinate-nucleotide diphosphorylase (carboxylating) [Rhodopseudomonas palustris]|nr:nicotinate-nucleotide diphosphorylase (carboxylating) [Rhodopseudomonas palustris]